MPPLLSLVGFFEPNDLDPSPSSRVMKMDLFLGMGLWLDQLVELGSQALYTDLLVRRTASINLEKAEKDRFCRIRFLNITWTQMSTSTFLPLERNSPGLCHGTSSQSAQVFPWALGYKIKLSEGELALSITKFSIRHGHELLTITTKPDLRLTYQV